jgi:predicted CXXCH cytochrome family protein
MSSSDAAYTVQHAIQLTGLTPGTLYYYNVISTDPSGNSAESGDYLFSTEGVTACSECHGSLPEYDHFDGDGHGKDGVDITCAGCHDETHAAASYKHLKVINGYPYPDAAPDPYGAVLPRKDYCSSACHLVPLGPGHPVGYDYIPSYNIWTYIEILTPQDYISKYGVDPGTVLPGPVLPLLDVDNDSTNSYGDIVMCTTCHDEHGTSVGIMMTRTGSPSLCMECHTQ